MHIPDHFIAPKKGHPKATQAAAKSPLPNLRGIHQKGSTRRLSLPLTCQLFALCTLLALTACRSPDQGAGTIGPIKKWGVFAGDRVQSRPAVAPDGTVYVGSAAQYMHAFDPKGHLLWRFRTKGKALSPTVAPSGEIAFATTDAYLYVLSKDGRLLWKTQPRKSLMGCHPAISKNGLVLTSGHLSLLAYKLKDGTPVTIAKKLPPITSCLTLGPDDTLYFGVKNVLHAWTLQGKKRWTYDVKYLFKAPSFDTQGNLYVGAGGDGHGVIVSLTPQGKLRWKYQAPKLSTKGLNKLDAKWWGIFFPPVIAPGAKDLVAVRVGEGIIKLSLDGKTRRWTFPHPEGGRYPFNSQVAVAKDGMIYAGAFDQHFYAIYPNGKLHYRFLTRGRFFFGPTLSPDQSTVYIGSEDKHFYAFHTHKQKK